MFCRAFHCDSCWVNCTAVLIRLISPQHRDDQNVIVVVSAEGCSDDTTSYTFSVSGGKSLFMGRGDLHDEAYDEYSVSGTTIWPMMLNNVHT